MPEIIPIPETKTGVKNMIIQAVPGINERYAQRAAYRMIRKQEKHAETLDFYQQLRILGIISDPTPRDAIRNIERQAT